VRLDSDHQSTEQSLHEPGTLNIEPLNGYNLFMWPNKLKSFASSSIRAFQIDTRTAIPYNPAYVIQMKSIIPKINILCICFAVIFTASAVKAQAIYQAEESETITASSPNGNQTVTVVLPRRAIQPTEVALIVNS
jgi:hypothetical protein